MLHGVGAVVAGGGRGVAVRRAVPSDMVGINFQFVFLVWGRFDDFVLNFLCFAGIGIGTG